MDKYISNLIPRLKQFGQKLNKIEYFVDKTWVLFDPEKNYQTFRFQRSGKLLIATSGLVEEHYWEYIPPDSLYIKRSEPKGIIYTHAFFLDSLFVLQREGVDFDPLLFYCESDKPIENLEDYIFHVLTTQNNIYPLGTEKKYFLEGTIITEGAKMFDHQLELLQDKKIAIDDLKIIIKNGVIVNVDKIKLFKTSRGIIEIASNKQERDGEYYYEDARVTFKNSDKYHGWFFAREKSNLIFINIKNEKINYCFKITDSLYKLIGLIFSIILFYFIIVYFKEKAT